MSSTVWKGSEEEALALERAIRANCQCPRDADGSLKGNHHEEQCGPAALMSSQRLIDKLLFARHIAARLDREEQSRKTISKVEDHRARNG